MSGPPRKRDEERRRRNAPVIPTLKVDLDTTIAGEIEIPAPPMREDAHKDDCPEDCTEHTGEMVPAWHRIAHEFYLSATRSGQAIFYEPSDWALLYALAESLSREFSSKPILTTDADGSTHIEWVKQPVNGAVMSMVLKGSTSLMFTEGERRRLHIELERKKKADAAAAGDNKVVSITQNRQELFQ